jgi:PAS domain S-box-containing protein
VQPVILILGYLGTLALARRARTATAPATLLLMVLSFGVLAAIFSVGNPDGGTHAVTMLLPALAVYLLGPRLGLMLTFCLVLGLGLGHPLYRMASGLPFEAPTLGYLWVSHLTTGIALLGAWMLGSLHTTARDEAQASLERTLKVLSDSEGKLSSVVESTDDLVVSVDPQGHLLTANAAARQLYRKLVGKELQPGQPVFADAPPELMAAWKPRIAQVLQGQHVRFEEEHRWPTGHSVLDISLNPILGEGGRVMGLTLFGRDITARRDAETRLGEMHRTLVDVSRQAGMAEIAKGVLHNVGNTLNSVNISTTLVTEQLRKSRLASLTRTANLLREHASDFDTFLTRDPQGQKLPSFLIALADHLREEHEVVLQEMDALKASVEHIKAIVRMQQKHARAAGAVEELSVPQLIDEALRLHAVSLERLGIHIERDYAQVPHITADRHRLLQILVNLLSNAQHALVESPRQDKRLSIRVRPSPEGERLLLKVADNGLGIAPENLTRIFTQGFTTKKTGHGFGLHLSALAAMEMGGQLSCTSPGLGQGATFTLELPLTSGLPPHIRA